MGGTKLLAALVAGLCLACGGVYASQSGLAPAEAADPVPGEAAKDRPNIVFLLSDDQAESTLARMPIVRSELVAKGRTFENTVNTLPYCCPSRATLQTGLYPHNTGVYENVAPHGGYGVFASGGHERRTAAVSLDAAGYNTAFLGRYMHGYTGSSVPPGWDRFNVELQAGGNEGEYVNRDGDASPLPVPKGRTADHVMSERAANVAAEWAAQEKPFFLTVGLKAPHAPAPHERRYDDLFRGAKVPRTPSFDEADVSDKPGWVRGQRRLRGQETPQAGRGCVRRYATSVGQGDCLYRNQLRSLQTVDRGVGGILRAIEEAGELDNTWVFYYTDNGLHLGEHRLKYGKLTPYATDASFPLIVRGPGVPAGTTSERLVGNHDVAPTLAAIAEAEAASPAPDGRSIVGAAAGDPEGWRTAIYSERKVFPDQRPVAGGVQDVPTWKSVRTERYSYVEYANGERELYDLDADPHQLQNLMHKPTPEAEAEAAELSARLDALKSCQGEGCRAAEGP